MSASLLTLKVKSMIYVDRAQNTPNYFVLEDGRPVQRVGDTLTFSITCGLNDSFAIATRYVASQNIAMPLSGNEAMLKKQFEMKKGLTRATSVYYHLNECKAFARLNITVDANNIRNILKSYLSVYAVPSSLSSGGVINCKLVSLNPMQTNRITQLMLMSIWTRNILG